jgi:hypothetical protein
MNVKELNHRAKHYIAGKQSGKINMSKAKKSNERKLNHRKQQFR